jgi:hypothetical protein
MPTVDWMIFFNATFFITLNIYRRAQHFVTMIAFNHYCIHRSIVVRNDVNYITFKCLNVNVRGKEHRVELTKKWKKTTDSST